VNKYFRLSKHSILHHRFGSWKYEASMTETQLRMLMGEVLQELTHSHHMHYTGVPLMHSHIPSAKNLLGCCLNHFATACITLLYDVNAQLSSAFVKGSKM
jgi:hypothetical protein